MLQAVGTGILSVYFNKCVIGQRNNIYDGRIRKNGGGRKTIIEKYENITEGIEQIIENSTVGNPEMVVLWTTKSLRGCLESLQQY